MTEEQKKELKVIISSLYYLENEAVRLELTSTSQVLKQAIKNMGIIVNNSSPVEALFNNEIIDSDLYNILTVINKFTKIESKDKKAIIKAMEMELCLENVA